MAEAFFLVGLGKKLVQAGGANAVYALKLPIGTFAITAKVEVTNKNSGITVVNGTLSPEGSGTIANKTTIDSCAVGMSGAADRDVLVLQAVVGTNSAATVFLRCAATAGSAEIAGGTITAIRLDDPNHLHITKANIQ